MTLIDLHVSGGISSSEDLVVLIHEALKQIVGSTLETTPQLVGG